MHFNYIYIVETYLSAILECSLLYRKIKHPKANISNEFVIHFSISYKNINYIITKMTLNLLIIRIGMIRMRRLLIYNRFKIDIYNPINGPDFSDSAYYLNGTQYRHHIKHSGPK